MEDKRWLRLLQPGITAIVGAGGKTTVLERLVAYGHGANLPVAVGGNRGPGYYLYERS